MKRLFTTFTAALFLAGGMFLARPAIAASEPETIVRAILAAYGPDSEPTDPQGAYFSPSLLKLWKGVEEGSKGDAEYAIDFDPFIDAQDFDTVTDIETTLTEDGPGKARVDIKFTAFGEQKAAAYDFVETEAGWKIDNIGWEPDRYDLRKLLDELRKDQRKTR